MVIAAVSPVFYLFALACPVGMGVMMWFMSKGRMGGSKRDQMGAGSPDDQPLADLKAEQARLAEKISALESKAGEGEQAPERERTPAG